MIMKHNNYRAVEDWWSQQGKGMDRAWHTNTEMYKKCRAKDPSLEWNSAGDQPSVPKRVGGCTSRKSSVASRQTQDKQVIECLRSRWLQYRSQSCTHQLENGTSDRSHGSTNITNTVNYRPAWAYDPARRRWWNKTRYGSNKLFMCIIWPITIPSC